MMYEFINGTTNFNYEFNFKILQFQCTHNLIIYYVSRVKSNNVHIRMYI